MTDAILCNFHPYNVVYSELLKKQDELAGLRGEIEMQKKSIKEQEKSWKKERRDLEV